MSSGVFSFDLHTALQQASRLEDLASDLENRSIRRMETVQQTLRKDWKGDSAAVFLDRLNQTSSMLQRRAAELRSTAASVRATAWRIYEMEQENMRIARSD